MSSITEHFSTRLAIGVCYALLASGCGGGSPVPNAPTAVQPTPNPPPAGPYTISGVVADENGRPIAGADFDACCLYGMTYSHWHLHDVLVTDASGRFQMTGIPESGRLWFRVRKDGYVEQCAAPPVTVRGDVAIDLALVSTADLTVAPPSAPGFRSVSGTVVEITATGKQPVSGAIVSFGPIEDFEVASTYSDQAGRFALCGLPTDEVWLGAIVYGSPQLWGSASVPPGQTTDIEIVVR